VLGDGVVAGLLLLVGEFARARFDLALLLLLLLPLTLLDMMQVLRAGGLLRMRAWSAAVRLFSSHGALQFQRDRWDFNSFAFRGLNGDGSPLVG
jgi:hypothetical protein